MLKLKLTDIQKTYKTGDEPVHALKGVSLEFRENEFVSILGQSGCGKTTLLNIIGGLDRYDSGDMNLSGLSTKDFKDADWDAYRNRSVGFVFQSYNLISHQTLLQNVEISMTLSGVGTAERRRRAKEALEAVGLGAQIRKKPNQLSGGQMQRVAIARALVNNPEIILADEPTGALDSQTSLQIMDILKEVAKTRLVIMVTHNGEIAEQYSNRIIRLLDGKVLSDSNPPQKDEDIQKQETKAVDKKTLSRTAMSMTTATSLSFKNLLTKKGRTLTTAFAGSIGIIGIALVLALSTGLSNYIVKMETESLSGFPITISTNTMTVSMDTMGMMNGSAGSNDGKFIDDNIMYRYDTAENTQRHVNVLTDEYLDYIARIETELPDAVNTISYTRNVEINLFAKGEDSVVKYDLTTSGMNFGGMMGGNTYWQEMPDSPDFILSLYDLIGEGSRLPAQKNEIAIVVDEYNRIDKSFFEKLGIYTEAESYTLSDFIGKTILKVIPNDNYYTQTEDGLFIAAAPAQYGDLYDGEGLELTIVGILRIKESVNSSMRYLSEGIIYTSDLTAYVLNDAQNSVIAETQKNSDRDVITNIPFANDDVKNQRLLRLGADTTPTGINIYPIDFNGKEKITEYLDAFNAGKVDEERILYTDMSETITSITSTLISTVSYVLIAFAAISLIVSTIMIAIITYVSVLERTKEIGVLRSVGARKKDISRVFNAEAMLTGLVAGLLGVGLTVLLSLPINGLISSFAGVSGIATLQLQHGIVLVLGSIALTAVAGFIPSRLAAKKDPVVALRTE